MIVVGGTYGESCAHPPREEVLGSGLRAAAALTAVDPDVVLHSAVSEADIEAAEAVTGALDVSAAWRDRDQTVTFDYFTPLSAPVIIGLNARADHIDVDADVAIVFGMLEDQPTVRAHTVIFDPQRPRDLTGLDLSSITAERLAVVANATETRVLGDDDDVATAARRLLERAGAEVVVTKMAAAGALVTTAGDQTMVPPRPTSSVWPIGSGDCFVAGFGWSWSNGADPVDAARVGSAVAAAWCGSGAMPLAAEDFTATSGPVELEGRLGRVYLAAPFFSLPELWFVETVADALASVGATVFSPMHDVGFGGDEVAVQDLDGLQGCQSVLSLLDGRDPGTIFETGWATANDVPVVGFTSTPTSRQLTMLAGTGALICDDLSTAVYHAAWASAGWRP